MIQRTGSLISADKTIVVPILSDHLVEGDETFTVKLTAPVTVPPLLGSPTTTTVTIHDAPYQKWQQTCWPSAIPSLPVFNDYLTAARSFSPVFHFRFSETSGTTVAGVDAAGATVATGNLTKTTSGNYSLEQPGPRPSAWPGMDSSNTAIGFTAATDTGTLRRYQYGGYANCGTANGVGGKLGAGFTITGFIKTAVTDHVMTIVGGKRKTTAPTWLEVNINQAYGNNTSPVPHTLRIYMRPETAQSLEYSVTLANLPTGSLCDGQWHHTMNLFCIQLRGELRKLFSRKRTYIGFGAFLVLEVTVLLLLQMPAAKGSMKRLIDGAGYDGASYLSGLTLAFMIMVSTVFAGKLHRASRYRRFPPNPRGLDLPAEGLQILITQRPQLL